MFRFMFWITAALACFIAGSDLEHSFGAPVATRSLEVETPGVAPESTPQSDSTGSTLLEGWTGSWQPQSTLALWQAGYPRSLAYVESKAVEHLNPTVWSWLRYALELPPVFFFALLSAVFLVLSRLSRGGAVAIPGGIRSSLRMVGLALAAAGMMALGADWAHGGTRLLGELWALVHAPSFAWLGSLVPTSLLERPAWIVCTGIGSLLAMFTRPRFAMPSYSGQPVVHLGRRDMRKIFAYLESMREWPRGRDDDDSARIDRR